MKVFLVLILKQKFIHHDSGNSKLFFNTIKKYSSFLTDKKVRTVHNNFKKWLTDSNPIGRIRYKKRALKDLFRASLLLLGNSQVLFLIVRTHPFHIAGLFIFLLASHLSALFSTVVVLSISVVVIRFKIDIFLPRIKER